MIAYVWAWIILLLCFRIIWDRMMRKPVPVQVEKPVRKYKVTRGGKRQ